MTGSDIAAANNSDEDESGAAFLIRILKYLETPQYLRKALFPKHNNLRFVVRPKHSLVALIEEVICSVFLLTFLL